MRDAQAALDSCGIAHFLFAGSALGLQPYGSSRRILTPIDTLSLMHVGLRLLAVLLAGSMIFFAGCDVEGNDGSTTAPPNEPGPDMDTAYLTDALWDDGRAEVAFYEVERNHTPYEDNVSQSFTVGTYLVKQDYSVNAQTKATEGMDGEPAFKYALFYDFESGSYDYDHNYVVNARQDDLRPYKESFTSFDWCSNVYRELAVHADETVTAMMRSDDYGNTDDEFNYRAGAYTPAQLPTVVRGLDFEASSDQTFFVMLDDGTYVQAQAEYVQDDTYDLNGEEVPAERITTTYEEPVPSMISEIDVTQETYWRGADDERLLLRVRGEAGEYEMNLIEHLRSAYWEEDVWEELERVTERP